MNTDTLHLHGWSEIPIASKHMANPITEHGPGHYGKELTKPIANLTQCDSYANSPGTGVLEKIETQLSSLNATLIPS